MPWVWSKWLIIRLKKDKKNWDKAGLTELPKNLTVLALFIFEKTNKQHYT